MDIFIIHSGQDRETIREKMEEQGELNRESSLFINAVLMEHDVLYWKGLAKKKISKAQAILVVVGRYSKFSRHIGWEIRTAIRLNKKIYLIKLDDGFDLHQELEFQEDNFTGEYCTAAFTQTSFDRLYQTLQRDLNRGDYGLFNRVQSTLPDGEENQGKWNEFYLEQYKLFVKTSEDLVTRRQAVNSFFLSIHSALIAIAGLCTTLTVDEQYAGFIGLFVCVTGIIVGFSWRRMLISYGQLNSAKMKIIAMLEEKMPLSLFDSEWQVLDDPLKKDRYKSFSAAEKNVPLIFVYMYGIILIMLLLSIFFPEETEAAVQAMGIVFHI